MTWASISAAVFDARARQPTPLGDHYIAVGVLEAYWASILHPGSVSVRPDGWFQVADLGKAPSGFPLGSAGGYLEGIRFYMLPGAIPDNAQYILRQHYNRADAWFRQKAPNRVTLMAPPPQGLSLTPEAAETLTTVGGLLNEVFQRISWIPADVRNKWMRVISSGAMPRLFSSGMLLQEGITPSFIRTESQMAAWDSLASDLNALTKTYIAAELHRVRQDAERIYANAEFWNRVAVYSGVDALDKAWNELTGAVRGFNNATQLALNTLADSKTHLDAAPHVYTSAQHGAHARLHGEVVGNVSKMRSAVGPFESALRMDDVMLTQGPLQGLGALPLVPILVGGVALALASAAAAAVLLHRTQAQATKASNELSIELFKTREAYDQQLHAAKLLEILEAEQKYRAMLAAGTLTTAAFNGLMAELDLRRRDADNQLARSREQNTRDALTINQQLKIAQDTGLETIAGGIRGTAAWMAVGAAAVAAIFVVPTMLKG